MTPPRRRWPDVAIGLAAVALGFAAVRWADREFFRTELTLYSPARLVSRPDWVWDLYHPYRRLQHDAIWASVAATLGAAALLARDGRLGSRRGRSGVGASVVLAALLVGGGMTVHHLLTARPYFGGNPFEPARDLGQILFYRVPGAIVGAWVVAWLGSRHRTRPDWRERLARLTGWLWLANVGLLIAFGLLFG